MFTQFVPPKHSHTTTYHSKLNTDTLQHSTNTPPTTQPNKLIQQFTPKISPSELSLPRETRRTPAQLSTNKSSILISYLHKVDETSYPSAPPPLQNTPTYHKPSIQLHTLIYLKQHTGPLDVSRESGASTSQVEGTSGRTVLNYWVVGPLHSYTQEG